MGNGVWATWAIGYGPQGTMGYRGMGYRRYVAHGQWGTGCMEYKGHGADGQWGTCNGLQGYGVHGGIGHMDNVAHG